MSKRLPRRYYSEADKAVMWDRGKEMANHNRFTLDTNIKVYFCDPKSPLAAGFQ